MSEYNIKGSAGGHVGKGNQGNVGVVNKWLISAGVAVFLIAALAWGTNGFQFSGMGIEGGSGAAKQDATEAEDIPRDADGNPAIGESP